MMLVSTPGRLFGIDARQVDGRRGGPGLLLSDVEPRAIAVGRAVSAVCLADGEIVLVTSAGHDRRLAPGVGEAVASVAILREDSLRLLLGTNDARVLEYDQGGGPARPLGGFERLECRSDWYTPWGGPPAVRSLALSGPWVYADIHVGSIMRSPDSGETWEPVTADLHEDVHQVATSPVAPERVYANIADGVYVSEDRGHSWEHRSCGLAHRYGRAVAVDPSNPDHLLASVSRGPHRNVDAQLYRSEDAGCSWTQATDGFPATSEDNIDTFHLAFDPEGVAWAAVGEILYVSENARSTWQVYHQFEDPIRHIACPPG